MIKKRHHGSPTPKLNYLHQNPTEVEESKEKNMCDIMKIPSSPTINILNHTFNTFKEK